MESKDPAPQPPRKQAGDYPLLWMGFWLIAFLGLVVFHHVRQPELGTGDLLLQSLLNSLPVAGVGLGTWAARRFLRR